MKKVLLLFMIIPASLFAGSEGVVFQELDMNIGARAIALGNVYTGIAEDSDTIFWNAAGLAKSENPEVSFSYNKWFLDTSFQYVTCVAPMSRGGVGLSVAYMSMGEFEYIDRDGFLTDETINPYGLNVAVGYANYVFDYYARIGKSKPDLSLLAGAVGRFAIQDDGYDSVTAVVFDMGLLMEFSSGISVGVAVQNVKIASEYSVPSNFRTGFAYKVVDSAAHKFMLAADLKQSFAGDFSAGVGTEYGFFRTFFARLGYDYQPGFKTSEGSLFGLNGGIGLVFEAFKIDYSVSTHGGLGTNHVVSLTYTHS